MGSKKASLIIQGSILASAGLISKLIGFFYRLQITNILGEQGNGIYSVAFGIYSIALTLSSYVGSRYFYCCCIRGFAWIFSGGRHHVSDCAFADIGAGC